MHLPKSFILLISLLILSALALFLVNFVFWERIVEFFSGTKVSSGTKVVLIDQSKSLKVYFRDKSSEEAVYDAIFLMWAKRLNSDPDSLKEQLAAGEEVKGTIYFYPKKGVKQLSSSEVDLQKPTKVIVEDPPESQTRNAEVRFEVSGRQLSIFLALRSSQDYLESAAVGGLWEALEILAGGGIMDPNFLFPDMESILTTFDGTNKMPVILVEKTR